MNRKGVIAAVVAVVVIAVAAIGFAATRGDHGDMMDGGMVGHSMDDMRMGTGAVAWDGSMMDMGDMPGTQMHASGAMAMSDQAFLAMMVAHHQMAVDMAEVELERGRDAETKAMARRVIADQQREIAQMSRWYRDWYGTEVPGMPMSGAMGMVGMSMDMGELDSTTEPDRVFLRQMISHHAGALLMADMVLNGEPRAQVRDLARTIVAAQAKEIGEMQTARERIAPPLG